MSEKESRNVCVCLHERENHKHEDGGTIIVFRACQIEGCACRRYTTFDMRWNPDERAKIDVLIQEEKLFDTLLRVQNILHRDNPFLYSVFRQIQQCVHEGREDDAKELSLRVKKLMKLGLKSYKPQDSEEKKEHMTIEKLNPRFFIENFHKDFEEHPPIKKLLEQVRKEIRALPLEERDKLELRLRQDILIYGRAYIETDFHNWKRLDPSKVIISK